MTPMQVINLIFSALFVVWMFLIAYLLWSLTRQNTERFQKLEQTLIDSVVSTASSFQQSIETTKKLVKLLEDKMSAP